jgi:cysteine desulfurase family protein
MDIVYLDHAASSWPKPPQVIEAMAECVREYAANPGRGAHRMSLAASRVLFETRCNLARLFGVGNPNDIVFASNASEALNLAIKGFVKSGQHVVTTSLEHNSVRRPLEYVKRKIGADVTYVPADRAGRIDVKRLEAALTPRTSLIVCSHASNLLGSIVPVEDIAEVARRHGARLLVDAAQTAGTYPIDIEKMGIDMLAFPGHKGLLGPQGTGGLYIAPDLEIDPLIHGGTGSRSEEPGMPSVRPDRYEAGTRNTPGIAGLNEGVKIILHETVETIHTKERKLTERLMEGLSRLPGLEILGPKAGEDRAGIVSFVLQGAESSEVADMLDKKYGIAVRAGWHCAPLAHETAGTLETGAVRASVGYYTTESDVDRLIEAMEEIGHHYRNRN